MAIICILGTHSGNMGYSVLYYSNDASEVNSPPTSYKGLDDKIKVHCDVPARVRSTNSNITCMQKQLSIRLPAG
jgi:hypothetical protein